MSTAIVKRQTTILNSIAPFSGLWLSEVEIFWREKIHLCSQKVIKQKTDPNALFILGLKEMYAVN